MRNQRRVTLIPTKVYDVTDETYKIVMMRLLREKGLPIPTQKTDEWCMDLMTAGGVEYDPKNRYYYDTDMKTKLLQGKERKMIQEEWRSENEQGQWTYEVAAYITKTSEPIYSKVPDKRICIEIHNNDGLWLLLFRQNLEALSPIKRR
jgi:hypothetical protein